MVLDLGSEIPLGGHSVSFVAVVEKLCSWEIMKNEILLGVCNKHILYADRHSTRSRCRAMALCAPCSRWKKVEEVIGWDVLNKAGHHTAMQKRTVSSNHQEDINQQDG